MLHIISYDIADDARRNRIADILKDFGRRVQLSVFEGLLDGALALQMKRRIKAVAQGDEDSIRFYSLCAECARKVAVVGKGTVTLEEKVYVVGS